MLKYTITVLRDAAQPMQLLQENYFCTSSTNIVKIRRRKFCDLCNVFVTPPRGLKLKLTPNYSLDTLLQNTFAEETLFAYNEVNKNA